MKYFPVLVALSALCFSQLSMGQGAEKQTSFGSGEYLEEETDPEGGINFGVGTGEDFFTDIESEFVDDDLEVGADGDTPPDSSETEDVLDDYREDDQPELE